MEEKKWRFGAVGNIKESHVGEDGTVYYGTKAFTPGTKVYLDGKFWAEGLQSISVIGLNRFGRFVLEKVPVDLIENVRATRIYKPCVLAMIDHVEVFEGWIWWGRTAADRKATEQFAKVWKGRLEENGT
ncbi:MAG: hypothetical protein IJW29_09825 [Clostridia bacterium]|nr:hypothetical protein [Clostridia bacterium]MBQ9785787.1 hypothetical protein [Clostridia bacterium]